MTVWQCYFENCNNDSNFQCQIPALQGESRQGRGGGGDAAAVLMELPAGRGPARQMGIFNIPFRLLCILSSNP